MIHSLLDWETENFGYKCVKIKLDSSEFETINNLNLSKIPCRLAVVESLNELPGSEDFLVDEKIVFEKNLNSSIKLYHEGEIITGKDLTQEILELATLSGKNSRFRRDKHFKNTEFDLLYTQWIQNSLNGSIADVTYVIGNYTSPKALVTLKQNESAGCIGLLSVNPSFQGQGLGQELLKWSELFCIEKNLTSIIVPTQRVNYQACNLYRRHGFSEKSTTFIYHWWN